MDGRRGRVAGELRKALRLGSESVGQGWMVAGGGRPEELRGSDGPDGLQGWKSGDTGIPHLHLVGFLNQSF